MIKVSALSNKVSEDTIAKAGEGDKSSELHARIQFLKDKTSPQIPKFKIHSSGGLKTLKVISDHVQDTIPEDPVASPETTYERNIAPLLIERRKVAWVNIFGGILTGIWLCGCFFYLFYIKGPSVLDMSAQEFGGYLSFTLAPAALLWLILSNVQRRNDLEYYTVLLRSELHNILFPEGESPDKVSKDVERLCRQASELSSASKAVMKTVQRARHGLREDIKDFVNLSKKTEFHINQLSENLNVKSEKLLNLSAQIEDRFERINKAGDAAGKRTEKISEKLEALADKVEGVNEGALVRLERAEQGLSRQTDALSVVTNDLENEVLRIGDGMSVQLGHLEDMSARILKDLVSGTDKLLTQKEALEGLSVTIEAPIASLKKIDDTSESLRRSLGELSGLVMKIEDAGEITANMLGESLTLAVSGADTLRESVKGTTDNFQQTLDVAMRQTEDMIERAVEKVRSLQSEDSSRREYLSDYLDKFDQQQSRLNEIKSDLKEDLGSVINLIDLKSEKLVFSLEKISSASTSAEKILKEPLQQIEAAFEGFDKRQERLGEVISVRLGSLNEIGDKVLGRVEEAAKLLRDEIQSVSGLSGQVSAQTQKLNREVVEHREFLSKSIRETLGDITNVSSILGQNVKKAEEFASKSENIINNINNNIKVNSEELKGLSDGSIKTLRSFSDQINEELARFDTICETLEEKTHSASATIEQTLSGMTPNCQDIFIKIEDLDKRFTGLKESVLRISEENISTFKQLADEFDLQLLNIDKSAVKAVSSLNNVNDSLQISVDQIRQASNDAVKQINGVQKNLESQSDSILLAGDQIVLKFSDIQKSIEMQNNELSEVLGASITQIKNAANELGDTARMTADVSEEVVAKITESITHTELKTEHLQKSAEERVSQTGQIILQVTHMSDELLDKARENIKEMEKTKGVFISRNKEMEAQLESVLRMAGYYGDEIRKQAKLVAQTSLESADTITKAGRSLKGEVGSMNVIADEVSLKIRSAQNDLSRESKDLIRVSTEVLKQTEQSAQHFAKQSSQMDKLSGEIKKATLDLKSVLNEQEQDAFAASARYVLESVFSITLDLSRAVDGGISEKMWKSFNDGDISVFLRRLQQIEREIPFPRLQEKFKNDHEFRTYAKRYMSQFEKIYKDVEKQQQNNLLKSVIRSSDIAKLYAILTKIGGQKDITN